MNYDQIDAINWSTLKHILKSPRHYQSYLENPPPQTAAQRFGVAVHAALLEPDEYQKRYVRGPAADRRTKAYKEFVEKFQHDDIEILTALEWDKIADMHQAFSEMIDDFTAFIWEGAEVEQVLTGELDGVECKGRADILTSDYVWDLKTCQDASTKIFAKDFHRYQYAAQLAFYADLAGKKKAGIIAIEKDSPYGVNVLTISDETLDHGRDLYKQALKTLKTCLDRNDWPAYQGGEL